MTPELKHWYRHFRAHQMATWHRESNSGGSAWPGCHAQAAYQSARMHINFLERYAPKPKRRRKAKAGGIPMRNMRDFDKL